MAYSPPSGIVTFLFTDMEGSASLAQRFPESIQGVLARHDAIMRNAIESRGGVAFQVIGDAFCAAFHTIGDAIQAALDAQRALAGQDWAPASINVRMGIHTGAAQAVTEGAHSLAYAGYLTLTRAQRVMSVARGGQILLSNASANLAREQLRDDLSLLDLGAHRLKGLTDSEHLWQLSAAGLRQDFAPLNALNTIPNNLPIQLSSIVGRDQEVREVRKLLETHRLVTLTGSGGTGKTRLSLQVATEALGDFKDGVWFVELAPLFDPELVPSTVAAALGVRGEPGQPLTDALLDWLEGKQLLLVLDNCEHLIAACAQFAETMLQASRGSRLLASSLEPLAIPGEQTYLVTPLQSPKVEQVPRMTVDDLLQYPAVRLFVERAQEAVPSFELSPANRLAVVQICYRLDGIPLAIELAAARIKVLQVEQIAQRLDDRFRLLTGGGRTRLPRHQTLRSLIDWSYGLLNEAEQVLLRRLSAFAGSCTLQAAERVCAGDNIPQAEILELLAHLVDKSLVIADEGAVERRYRMLETIRQYAQERLQTFDEGGVVRGRHLEYFVALAEAAQPKLHGPEQFSWLDRLEAERDNLRSALEWSRVDHRAGMGLRLVAALYRFWDVRGYWSEGYEAAASALLEAAQEKSVVRARALVAAGALAARCGLSPAMDAFFDQAFSVLRDCGQEGAGFFGLALSEYAVAIVDRDPKDAKPVAEQGIRASRQSGDRVGEAYGLYALGMISRRRSDFAGARAAQEESMALFRELGDQRMYALLLSNLAYTHYHRGDLAEGKARFDESIEIAREIGDRYVEGNSLPGRGDLARRLGDYAEAATLLHQGLAYHREIGAAHQALVMDLYGLALLHLSLGDEVEAKRYLRESMTAAEKGDLRHWFRALFDARGYLAAATDPGSAARLFGAAERLREQLETGLYPYERDEYEKYVKLAHSQLEENDWKAAWEEGRGMTLEQSITYALRLE